MARKAAKPAKKAQAKQPDEAVAKLKAENEILKQEVALLVAKKKKRHTAVRFGAHFLQDLRLF